MSTLLQFREGINLIRQTKIDTLEGDLHIWKAKREECADQGTKLDCEVQICHIQNDLRRLQTQ
jgi:hypothetical protein